MALASFSVINPGSVYAVLACIVSFISLNGENGREMVMRICKDPGYAKEALEDEDMSKPIRFLDQVVVEANTNSRFPKKGRAFGFGVANC